MSAGIRSFILAGIVAAKNFQPGSGSGVIAVESVSLDESYIGGTVGEPIQLTATVLPENATDKTVSWGSDDEAVAIVSSSGLVTIVAEDGACIITVTTTDGGKIDTTDVIKTDYTGDELDPAGVDEAIIALTGNGYLDLTFNFLANAPRTSASDAAVALLTAGFNNIKTELNIAPTDLTLIPSSILEGNSIGDVVGVLTAVDANDYDTHTFSLVSGTGDTDNASFTVDGTDLKAAEEFDYETKTSYSIRLQVEDANGETFAKQVTVSITNDETDDPTLLGEWNFNETTGNLIDQAQSNDGVLSGELQGELQGL